MVRVSLAGLLLLCAGGAVLSLPQTGRDQQQIALDAAFKEASLYSGRTLTLSTAHTGLSHSVIHSLILSLIHFH